MKTKNYIAFAIIFAVLAVSLCRQAEATEPKKIYHWPYLKLTPYTSAQYNYMPSGDIDDKRAFYWGRVLGSDGLAFDLRGPLPHLIEGNWQEKVYNNQTEKDYIFNLVKDFQDTYAAYGCDDSFYHIHAHPTLEQTVEQWRADVITGMTQKAELMAYAGIDRFLIDMEFSSQDTVSTDPQFWYDLGGDIITAMRTENTDFKFGFYPGLVNYRQTLSDAEMTNPRSIGTYPDQSSIPENKRNMRHALFEGIYNNLNGTTMWYFIGWTYGPSHMCAGTKTHSYVFNLDELITGIKGIHTAMLGAGIEYMPAKWDLGASQSAPVGKHWKQPNLSLMIQKRNYDIIYQHTDYAAVWDDYGSWDDDGVYYLTYPTMQSFIDDIDDIQIVNDELPDPGVFAFTSAYSYDTITGQIHHIFVPMDASISEKLEYFNVYTNGISYHITGKHSDNFPDYVDTMIVAAGKDEISIPLRDSDEYSWAKEYKAKGFFKNHEVVYTPDDPSQYGCLRPSQCAVDRASDINKDCEVNIVDFAMMATTWLQCSHPNDANCE